MLCSWPSRWANDNNTLHSSTTPILYCNLHDHTRKGESWPAWGEDQIMSHFFMFAEGSVWTGRSSEEDPPCGQSYWHFHRRTDRRCQTPLVNHTWKRIDSFYYTCVITNSFIYSSSIRSTKNRQTLAKKSSWSVLSRLRFIGWVKDTVSAYAVTGDGKKSDAKALFYRHRTVFSQHFHLRQWRYQPTLMLAEAVSSQ